MSSDRNSNMICVRYWRGSRYVFMRNFQKEAQNRIIQLFYCYKEPQNYNEMSNCWLYFRAFCRQLKLGFLFFLQPLHPSDTNSQEVSGEDDGKPSPDRLKKMGAVGMSCMDEVNAVQWLPCDSRPFQLLLLAVLFYVPWNVSFYIFLLSVMCVSACFVKLQLTENKLVNEKFVI